MKFAQLKASELRAATALGSELAHSGNSLEAQVLGYSLLQHLVANRWDEFTSEEKNKLASLCYDLMQQATGQGSYAIRSKSAFLLSLLIKRSGSEFWEAALPQLLSFASDHGTPAQEIVAMVLHYVADEIMQFGDDVQGDVRRVLLSCLLSTAPPTLAFLQQIIEQNVTVDSPGSFAVVQAALAAAAAYAEWVPVRRLIEPGLMRTIGTLLNNGRHREAACDVFHQFAGRKRGDESKVVYDAAVTEVATILIAAAEALLAQSVVNLQYEGDDEEFGLLFCETLATAGGMQWSAFQKEQRNSFLNVMLRFAQIEYPPLAIKSLAFWAKWLHDLPGSVVVESGNYGAALPMEGLVALIDIAADQLEHRATLPQEGDEVPPYFDDHMDYREFMVNYRSHLSAIIRGAAAIVPDQAFISARRRLDAALESVAGHALLSKTLLDSSVFFFDSVVKAAWDASVQADTNRVEAVIKHVEPILQTLLALRVSEPAYLHIQAQGISSCAKLLIVRPNLVAQTIHRLLEILATAIILDEDGRAPPPMNPPPGWREKLLARQAVAAVIVSFSRTAPEAFLPHLESLAAQSKELWDKGLIRFGEHNAIKEGIVAAAAVGPEQLQVPVLEFVLAPVRSEWSSQATQTALSSPENFIATFMPSLSGTTGGGGPAAVGGGPARWALYHQIHLIERSIRAQVGGGADAVPLAVHLEWALPVMLQVVSLVHAVYTPAGRSLVGPGLQLALELSTQEKAFFLRKIALASSKGRQFDAQSSQQQQDDSGDYSSVGDASISGLRAWLRHAKEFVYHTIGMLPTQCPAAMESSTLLESFCSHHQAFIESLDHQNARLVIRHVILPLIRACPARHLPAWVVGPIATLAPHMQSRLTDSWTHLMTSNATIGGASEADEEIIKERLLRELTLEYAELLREVTVRICEDPTVPLLGAKGKPPVPLLPATAPGKKTLLELMLEVAPSTGFIAATTAVAGMTWPDDSAMKFATFCKALVALAPRDESMKSFVGSQVLRAAISCLALTNMATRQADILALIRNILAQQWGLPGPTSGNNLELSQRSNVADPILSELPGMTPEKLRAFKAQLTSSSSEKSQRDMIKKMLKECSGMKLNALADSKAGALQLSEPRSGRSKGFVDPHSDQLQAEAYQALFKGE